MRQFLLKEVSEIYIWFIFFFGILQHTIIMWSLIIEYQIVQQTHGQRNRKQKVKPSYNQINPAGNRSSHFHRSHGLNSGI